MLGFYSVVAAAAAAAAFDSDDCKVKEKGIVGVSE